MLDMMVQQDVFITSISLPLSSPGCLFALYWDQQDVCVSSSRKLLRTADKRGRRQLEAGTPILSSCCPSELLDLSFSSFIASVLHQHAAPLPPPPPRPPRSLLFLGVRLPQRQGQGPPLEGELHRSRIQPRPSRTGAADAGITPVLPVSDCLV